VSTAYRWWREGALPVPARKLGRLVLVAPGTAAGLARRDGAGLYARVSSRDQKRGLGRLLAGPGVTVVMVEHRDRFGRVNTELAGAALAADGRRLAVVDDGGVTGDLAGDVIGVLAWLCACLCGRGPARNRALEAAGCARRDIGPRAVPGAGAGPCGGGR
jgi:putative resolvase